MAFASSGIAQIASARLLFGAIAFSLGAIALLLAFIIARRWIRSRYFARRDALAAHVRLHWDELVLRAVLPGNFRSAGLARDVLEAILLDRIEVAHPDELPALVDCLRRCGALDIRIREARLGQGWRRRAALVILGRTRAPEAVPALAEALDDNDIETRIAAVRGLGKIADPAAAVPMLERFVEGHLELPVGVLKNALLNCCAHRAGILVLSMTKVQGARRDLLARILSELADSVTCDELLVLASDQSAEIRASAARGLSRIDAAIALPPLAELASDTEWFVRLRAVVALATFVEQGAVPVLVRLLGDRNRLVRQRAAWALIRCPRLVPDIVKQAVAAGDDYGLQALVAELDRCGLYGPTIERLERTQSESAVLIAALDRAHTRLGPAPEQPPARLSTNEVCVA